MYETIRIVEKLSPKYVIWENVKNLLSKKHIHNFEAYLQTMERLGYKNYYQILNAKDYGIPQNRERVFTVSIRNDIDKKFIFPEKQLLKLKLKDMLEDEVNDYYYNVCPSMIKALEEGKVKNVTNLDYCNTLTTKQARWNNAGMIIDKKGLRYLSGIETWRLMGFDDKDFEKASKVNSNTQLYKQAGNSIVVNILVEILKKLI